MHVGSIIAGYIEVARSNPPDCCSGGQSSQISTIIDRIYKFRRAVEGLKEIGGGRLDRDGVEDVADVDSQQGPSGKRGGEDVGDEDDSGRRGGARDSAVDGAEGRRGSGRASASANKQVTRKSNLQSSSSEQHILRDNRKRVSCQGRNCAVRGQDGSRSQEIGSNCDSCLPTRIGIPVPEYLEKDSLIAAVDQRFDKHAT